MLIKERVIRENKDGVKFESDMVFGIGNLTADVQTKTVNVNGADKVVTTNDASVALNIFVEGKKETVFMQIEAWEKVAENLEKMGTKGRKIFVSGKHKENKWKDKDGKERITEVVVVERFQLLDFVEKKEEGAAPDFSNETGFVPTDEDIPF